MVGLGDMGGMLEQAQQTAGNDSGVTCRWLLVGACGPLAAAIGFLVLWVKALIKEKDEYQDARIKDFQDRYDKLAARRNKEHSDS